MQEIKETQKVHTALLQSLMRQQALQRSSEDGSDDLDLPLKTMADFDVAEEKLQGSDVKKRLVC